MTAGQFLQTIRNYQLPNRHHGAIAHAKQSWAVNPAHRFHTRFAPNGADAAEIASRDAAILRRFNRTCKANSGKSTLFKLRRKTNGLHLSTFENIQPDP